MHDSNPLAQVRPLAERLGSTMMMLGLSAQEAEREVRANLAELSSLDVQWQAGGENARGRAAAVFERCREIVAAAVAARRA